MRSQKYVYLYILILLAIVTHIAWFMPGNTLFHADWAHWSNTAVKQSWNSLGSWSNFSMFGQPSVQVGFYIFQGPMSLLSHLGASYDMAVKITLMMPIAILSFVAP